MVPGVAVSDEGGAVGAEGLPEGVVGEEAEDGFGEGLRGVAEEEVGFVDDGKAFGAEGGGDDGEAPGEGVEDLEAGAGAEAEGGDGEAGAGGDGGHGRGVDAELDVGAGGVGR